MSAAPPSPPPMKDSRYSSREKRNELGEKRFHSETSLNHIEDVVQRDKDPGVYNHSSRHPSVDIHFTPKSSRRPSYEYLDVPRSSRRPSVEFLEAPPETYMDTFQRPKRQRAFSQPAVVFKTATATRANRKRSLGFEVFNDSSTAASEDQDGTGRRRTVSQPGPSVSTATAARARRKPRSVMYADQQNKELNKDGEDKFSFRLVLPTNSQHDSGTATPLDSFSTQRMEYVVSWSKESIKSTCIYAMGHQRIRGKPGSWPKFPPIQMTFEKYDNAMTTSSESHIPQNRSSPLPNVNFPNGDARSLNSYRMFTSNGDLRSVGTPRKRSVSEIQSIRSMDAHMVPPSTPDEKSKMTKSYLTLVLSVMYCMLLVTFGVIVFVSDPFIEYSISPIYCLYLVGVGFLYLIFLLIDIRIYLNKALRNDKVKEKHIENYEDFFRKQEESGIDGISGDGTKTPQLAPPPPAGLLKHVDHNYCFSHGRHAGSFYLKMGAAGFALGHMVHSVLLLTTQLSYLVEDGYEDCLDYPQIVLDFAYPIYSFLQLFFIFKYSNVIILRCQTLARFGFMHFIGSSLCFWVWTICRETVLALTIYAQSRYGTDYDTDSYAEMLNDTNNRFALEDLIDENCMGQPAINTIYSNFSPYLFPFTVEYNILIVGIFYIIWDNIGEHATDDDDDISSVYSGETNCKVPLANEENGYASNFIIHADCHASNRGIFGGLIIFVFTVAMVILTFIFSSIDTADFFEVAHVLNDSTKLALHVVMLVSVVMAYNQTRQLDVNQHPVSLLDDILLFICIPAFFMETIFTMVATISITNIIKCTDVVIMAVQIVIQTSFQVDGLRRCSNSRRLRRVKPGRELVMFLLITNVAMWIFYTFSFKSPDTVDERYEYYGKVLWSILGHVSLPLIMFYRFHSSVCMADIWKSAYQPGSEH